MRCDELVSKSQVFFEILMSYGEIDLIRVIYLECSTALTPDLNEKNVKRKLL